MVNTKAIPVSSKPSIEVINPKDAISAPPGTPGAPRANTPSKSTKRINVLTSGKCP